MGEFVIPAIWRLSVTEKEVFMLLLKRDVVTVDGAMTALYGHLPAPPFPKVISTWMFRLRKRLKPFGIQVEMKRGIGYSLVNRRQFTSDDGVSDEMAEAWNDGLRTGLEHGRKLFEETAEKMIAELYLKLRKSS